MDKPVYKHRKYTHSTELPSLSEQLPNKTNEAKRLEFLLTEVEKRPKIETTLQSLEKNLPHLAIT